MFCKFFVRFGKQNTNDMVHLRTLTEKSKVDFHWNSGVTVQELLDKKPYDLIRIYYDYEKINFSESVLTRLKDHFKTFYEIPKPGICKDWKIKVFGEKSHLHSENLTYQELKSKVMWYKINKIKVPQIMLDIYRLKKAEYFRNKIDTTENNHTKLSLRYLNQNFK